MTGKLMCRAAAVVFAFAVLTAPAKAQFGGSGDDMMTQMAPMLEMMKAKMGKKRFASLMQTMGPMMEKMMDGNGGGLGGMMGGGGFGGMNFGSMGAGMGGGMGGFGGGDMSGMMNMMGSSEMMGMIPQFVSMANSGGMGMGHRPRRAKHR